MKRRERFVLPGAHGVIVGLPVEQERPREELLARLLPEEAALAAGWGERRVRTFAAGRFALREALAELGADVRAPILRDARGAPRLPGGLRVSVSHKDELAVAIATTSTQAFVGVDVELLSEARSDISRHVLTEAERAELRDLDEESRKRELLVRFSLKESLYKALDPWVQRYVGFLEVEARPSADGSAAFTLALVHGEGPFDVDGRHVVLDDVVLTTARVTRLGRGQP